MGADEPRDETTRAESTLIDGAPAADGAGPMHVIWRESDERKKRTFHESFTLGRDRACDISVADTSVSRSHVQIYPDAGRWHIKDLGSANGSFLDDIRIHVAVLPKSSVLQLGHGPKVGLQVPGAPESITEEEIKKRYFSKQKSSTEIGNRTAMMRNVFRRVDRRQKVRYRVVIALIAAALSASVGFAWYQYQVLEKTRELATAIFYNMKSVEVQVAQIEDLVRETDNQELIEEVASRRQEVRALEDQYDRFLEELDILGPELSDKDRVVLRVARMLGECELTMPPDFTAEVNRYIHQWKLSSRLRRSIARMHEQDLTQFVVDAMLEKNLPPQFLYVALQESSFDKDAIGPKTRFGIAKGMWQFIPSTARRYGLRTGPLVELSVPDPNDDRHKPRLATKAAARYLRDIYSKDAQASGLLVMASYNWGPNNIRRRIRQMPDNPRERNFWRLLERHEIPRETYDYVFYIVSAIVIGEDPALFGFDFDNPLRDIALSLQDRTLPSAE